MFETLPVTDAIAKFQPLRDNQVFRFKDEIGPGGRTFTAACYMIQTPELFSNPETVGLEIECRGIVFDDQGNVVLRPLHKFFNVGERPSTAHEQIDWTQVARVLIKRDGSMITALVRDGQIYARTKKTFDNDESRAASQTFLKYQNAAVFLSLCERILVTPVFEFTSPRFPIVVPYETDELHLLHCRNNVTGHYLQAYEMRNMLASCYCDIPLVEDESAMFRENGVVSWALIADALQTARGVEGWVIQFRNGDMVKAKTKWYLDLHHCVTFVRERDIATAVVNDCADDLRSAFTAVSKSHDQIDRIEQAIISKITEAQAHVEQAAATFTGDFKAMAQQWKDDEYFSLIMNHIRGKETNYFQWYEKRHLNSWSLDVVA